jgi:hypothetical protein
MKNNHLIPVFQNVLTRSMLKKCIYIFSLLLISLGVSANPKLATKQQIGMFKNSKTCVVLESGMTVYNGFIKDAVRKYWKSTEYEFIDQPEFEKRRTDSKYSFLVLMDAVYDKDPGGVSYSYINLVLGDAASNLTNMPELCSIPLAYTGDKFADYEYALPAIVKFIQKHAKNLETERFLISIKGLGFYNGKADFKDKVLLLNKTGMALYVDTPDRIKTVYPYYVKLLSAAEISDELNLNPSNALFLFHVGPGADAAAGKCFEMIFDVEGNLCYYNSRKITNDNGNGFNLDDFERIR